MTSKTLIIGASLIVAIAAILGIAYLAVKSNPSLSQLATTTPDVTASTSMPGYTIEQVPIEGSGISLPDLDRKVLFAASIPADARIILQGQINATVANLKKNPNSVADWYNLAIYYHEADDFDGARLVWEFLVKAAPNNPVAYENLGKLYHFDLKDFPKAEMYFKEAMTIDKTMDPYLELYELYDYSYKKDTSLAVDTLNIAAQKFATSSIPYDTLGDYYRTKGDTTDARAAFTKALDRARANGDVQAMAAIGKEISELPQ